MENENLLKRILTSFLTTTMNLQKDSIIEKCSNIILFLLEEKGEQSFQSKIATKLGMDRREISYALDKMLKAGILQVRQDIRYPKIIKINPDVKKQLNKMIEGVPKSPSPQPEPSELETELSKNHRGHRHVTRCFHNLSNFRFKQLRGKWLKNNTVIITEEFDDDFFDILFSSSKCVIYSPYKFGDDYLRLADEISIDVGKKIAFLERKYHMKLELIDTDKYEIAVKDDFNNWFAKEMQQEGLKTYTHPDWSFDASLGDPEIEHNQQWFQVHRKGEGVLLYTELLHFPRTFKKFEQQLLQSWASLSNILENISTYQMEKLATVDDIESLREDITQLIPAKTTITDQIEQLLLMEEPKSLLELAFALSMSKSGILHHTNKIKHKLILGKRKKEGRGRPERTFKLKEEK